MPDAGRVVTGSAGGLRLAAPGRGTRPFSDKVKQALFSIIETSHEDAWGGRAMDLFAGSGAAGIEALSRGAPGARFVERDAAAARVIRANLAHTSLEGRAEIVRADAVEHLATGRPPSPEARFRVVVLDPPFDRPSLLAEALDILGDDASGWLEPGAIVGVKHHWRTAPPDGIGTLRRIRGRRFGETAISVYRREADPEQRGEGS